MQIECLGCGYVGESKVVMGDLADTSYGEIHTCPECGCEDVNTKPEPKAWLSPFDTCEICHGPIKGVAKWFVDGATKQGPWAWALMCPQCFELYGVGIRYGLGQKYDGNTGVLLEGGHRSWK